MGIFIGGGAFAELDVFSAPYHYSDVPEWGALLSNVRRYARAYPWTAIYPSLAFFIAILGFNLFGEGVRRLVESVGVVINRLFNRYTVAAAVLIALSIGWVQANTGATAVYQRQAKAFDGSQAYDQVRALLLPPFEGRALGTEGMNTAAFHISQLFDHLELDPAGEEMTYFQKRERSFEQLEAVPQLTIHDGGQALVYHQDFVEYVADTRVMGEADGKVRFVALGEVTKSGTMVSSMPKLEELDFSDEILLVLSQQDADLLRRVPSAGILVVTQNTQKLDRRRTLSSRDPHYQMFGTGRERGQDKPMFWISEAVAKRLLEGMDRTLGALRSEAEDLDINEVLDLPMGVTASMKMEGKIRDGELVRHVIGNWTGVSDSRYGGINDEMIVVMAQYDSPPPTPDDAEYPAANDNASGVAVMLEAVRAMREADYQPYRTFLFVAYSGEGLEGGEWVYPPDVERFLEAKRGFSSNFTIVSVVDLRGVGAGEGNGLVLSAGGSMRLADLLERSAHQTGVKARRGGETVDISIVFDEKSRYDRGQEAPKVGLRWEGWEKTSRRPADTLASVSQDKLEKAGRALSLALMVLGRERQY